MTYDFTDELHIKFYKKIYDIAGINLEKKKELLKCRLLKRMTVLKITSYEQYYNYVINDVKGEELSNLLTAVSTNITSFFREIQHFDFLKKNIVPKIFNSENRIVKGWSAASSSGEEAYSILITIMESVQDLNKYDLKITGTDISTKVLEQASSGVYSFEKLKTVEDNIKNKYFKLSDDKKFFEIRGDLKRFVNFKYFNLMSENYPFNAQFDFIFCRNVIIYFDRKTQQKVIDKLIGSLKPEGYLIVGHSECLTGIEHNLKYIQPTIYSKSK
ncbi:methyltransferase [Candidatus Dependentiae bacterium]|nr:methyltransferase [Candidatus Dependentiae bacterium]